MTDPLPRGSGRDVILQAFHWNLVKTAGTGTLDGGPRSWYAVLTSLVDEIAALGFTVAYLPPPWRDDSHWEHGEQHGGGEGYFWHDFDLDSRYGTKTQLTALVSALHARGLKAVCDIVPNHRDRSRMQRDVWPYPGPCWRVGGADDGGGFLEGEFDLALAEPVVHERLRAALDELMDDCGIDGWRWDFVWGYEPGHVVSLVRGTRKEEYLSMGEYWQGDGARAGDPMVQRYGPNERERILGWAREARSLAFDILCKREINTANPAYLKHSLNASPRREDRELMITYVENHDTGASPFSPSSGWGQKHWETPEGYKPAAYAYILSMPGTPMVYWPDCFDWGLKEELRALVAARRSAGIVAWSDWIDLTDDYPGFAGIVKDAAGEAALALAIRSPYPGPGPGWSIAAAHEGEYTVWTRDAR